MSRAMDLDRFHILLERARARLFPPSKWAGLFPSAAYRRSAPPQVAWSILKWRCLGCVYVAWMASQRRKTDLTFGASHTQIVPLGIIPHRNLDIFVTQKASVGSNPRWHFLRAGGPVARRRSVLFNEQGIHTRPASREARCRAAVKPRTSCMSLYAPARLRRAVQKGLSPRAMRPVAEWRSVLSNQQRNHIRPASRGTCRATVVKPRPSCMPLYAPARHGRAVRGQGALPLSPA